MPNFGRDRLRAIGGDLLKNANSGRRGLSSSYRRFGVAAGARCSIHGASGPAIAPGLPRHSSTCPPERYPVGA